MTDSPWLTTDECAAHLKLRPKTIREYAQKGKIPYYKVGSRLRYHRGEIDTWFEKYHVIALTYTEGGGRPPSGQGPSLMRVDEQT